MKLSQKQIIIVSSVALAVILLFALLFLNLRPSNRSQEFTLKIWGVDDGEVFDNVAQSYKQIRPGATVKYTKIDPKNFESGLLNALASGEGPDIFYIGNRELPKQKVRLIPVNTQQFNLVRLRELFPTAVEQDFVSGGQVYALPLFLDTLALIYNKDLFDQAGIVAPPKTWDEFQRAVSQLRVVNPNGQIVRAAAAIGGSENSVDSAADLLTLLMLQNGAKMVSSDLSSAAFASQEGGGPGIAAFNFYLQFTSAGSPNYTWNDGQQNSLDSFVNGKTAMIFNYQSAVSIIKSKSPFLNFAVAPMPQPGGAGAAVNYPRYYGLAVSKQSRLNSWAWDFIVYLTANPEVGKIYTGGNGRPPALRSLIGQNMNDPNLNVFVKQALTARSWYEADDAKIKSILNNAIVSVLTGQADSEKSLKQAQDQVSQLMGSSR